MSDLYLKYQFLFQKLIATRVWEIKLTQGSQRIAAVISKSSIEKVHSQGRVLGDRSVLYKYINPNLVAVLTEGFDPVHRRESLCCHVMFVVTEKDMSVAFSNSLPAVAITSKILRCFCDKSSSWFQIVNMFTVIEIYCNISIITQLNALLFNTQLK